MFLLCISLQNFLITFVVKSLLIHVKASYCIKTTTNNLGNHETLEKKGPLIQIGCRLLGNFVDAEPNGPLEMLSV